MAAPAQESARSPAIPPLSFPQKMRIRVGMSVAATMLVVSVLLWPASLLAGDWIAFFTGVGSVSLAIVSLVLYRRNRTTLPSALILGWILLAIVFSSSLEDGVTSSISPWTGVLALLSLYLLGPRHGALFAAISVLQIGWAFLLDRTGMTLPMRHTTVQGSAGAIFSCAIAISMIAVLGYLYELAQKRTLGELADALITSEQNERQLDAMFESTTAAICSLDPRLRLIACNQVFASMTGARGRGALAPQRGDALDELLPLDRSARWQPHLDRVLASANPVSFEEAPPQGQDGRFWETMMHPIALGGRVAGVTVYSRDITERKRAEVEMRRLHQELVRVSREAGMAAVASEVLHNAGNVLNSTGVSVAMLERHLHGLRIGHLGKAVALLEEHAGGLDAFVRDDPRGRRMFELLRGLVAHFEQQRRELGAEVATLQESIHHLTAVIHAQQNHARSIGLLETVAVNELVEAALDLQAPAWAQLGITLERQLAELPPLHVDKHKAIEILVNLIGNARHAVRDSARDDKRIVIRTEAVGPAGAPARVRIHVEDNGVGIDPAHGEKLFRLGFTTKRGGSGIGLHSSANAAQQLGGSLSFRSDGPGQGAVFTLELPLTAPRAHLQITRSATSA
jgi:PAS domain S-box-containing protein